MYTVKATASSINCWSKLQSLIISRPKPWLKTRSSDIGATSLCLRPSSTLWQGINFFGGLLLGVSAGLGLALVLYRGRARSHRNDLAFLAAAALTPGVWCSVGFPDRFIQDGLYVLFAICWFVYFGLGIPALFTSELLRSFSKVRCCSLLAACALLASIEGCVYCVAVRIGAGPESIAASAKKHDGCGSPSDRCCHGERSVNSNTGHIIVTLGCLRLPNILLVGPCGCECHCWQAIL